MADNRRQLGAFGERAAKHYLEKQGYKILKTNFRCPVGEIDIVSQKDDYLVFVEVRTRRGLEFGSPEESITQTKKEKLIELGESYIQQYHDSSVLWRIDVVAIEVGPGGKITLIESIENAID